MALAYAHGAIQWNAADAATATYVVNTLTFEPKALRFYYVGIASATDATSDATNLQKGIGFAVSTSSRRCVSAYSQDAAAAATCTSGYRDDCIAMVLSGTPAAEGLLDLTAVASDGFTLTVDDQSPIDITIFWEAWGGSDITVAAVGDIAEPAAIGTQDYAVTGFTLNATDQVVMLAGVQTTGTSPSAVRNDSGLCIGFTTGTAAANNICFVGNSDDASATMDVDEYPQAQECLAMILVQGGNPSARAVLSAWGTDLFTLDWLARGTTDRRYIFLAIKGGSWAAGSTTIDASAASTTAEVSGLSFAPKGICTMFYPNAEPAAGSANTNDRISLGSAASTTDRRAMGYQDDNGQLDSAIRLSVDYDAVARIFLTTSFEWAMDVSAFDGDGFHLVMDVAVGGNAASWVGYLAFGDAPAASGGHPLFYSRRRAA